MHKGKRNAFLILNMAGGKKSRAWGDERNERGCESVGGRGLLEEVEEAGIIPFVQNKFAHWLL